MTACVFDDLVGQERVAEFLRGAVESESVSHAYLFVGPSGSGKRSAALRLACALVCDDGGCGVCSACTRVKRGAHPDVRVFEPTGAASYLVEQMRDEIVPDVWLAPAEARAKVYVIERADALGESAANAFLKTLEEPPSTVTFVLLAEDFDAVLPTIVSRCQVVHFVTIPPSRAVALLAERTGAGVEEAGAALAASAGVLPRALEFLRSPSRREARERTLQALRDLPTMDGLDVLVSARDLLRSVRAPLDELKERQEAELKDRVEFMGKAAGSLKELEARNRREITAREREAIGELLSVIESWLRDVLAVLAGATAEIVNRDAADDVAAAAESMDLARTIRALAAVAEARRRVSYNVSPQLALEAMLFEILEVRTCPQSWE
jgi:DNA polymerase-3 subunit delta'